MRDQEFFPSTNPTDEAEWIVGGESFECFAFFVQCNAFKCSYVTVESLPSTYANLSVLVLFVSEIVSGTD